MSTFGGQQETFFPKSKRKDLKSKHNFVVDVVVVFGTFVMKILKFLLQQKRRN